MLRPIPNKKKISVRLYPRLAATNQSGFCPVRLTARWHGEELQVDTGEIILPQRVRSDGEVEKLWQSDAQMVLGGPPGAKPAQRGSHPIFNQVPDGNGGQPLPDNALFGELVTAGPSPRRDQHNHGRNRLRGIPNSGLPQRQTGRMGQLPPA